MSSVVYWIRLKSHKCIKTEGYIGVTNNYKRRVREHFRYEGHSTILYNAIKKYGSDEIISEVIFSGPREGCLQIEEYFRPNALIGWNMVVGGGKGAGAGAAHPLFGKEFVMTEKRKEHYATYKREGYKHSEATIEKIRKANTGKKLTLEHIEKIVNSKLGVKQSTETIEKRKLSLMGHSVSDSTKAKISKANKGRKLTDEHRKAMSNSHIGKNVGLKSPSAIAVNVYEYKTNKLIAEKVCASEYARNNDLSPGNLWRTLNGDRQQPGSRSNIVQHKNLYITRWESKDEI